MSSILHCHCMVFMYPRKSTAGGMKGDLKRNKTDSIEEKRSQKITT